MRTRALWITRHGARYRGGEEQGWDLVKPLRGAEEGLEGRPRLRGIFWWKQLLQKRDLWSSLGHRRPELTQGGCLAVCYQNIVRVDTQLKPNDPYLTLVSSVVVVPRMAEGAALDLHSLTFEAKNGPNASHRRSTFTLAPVNGRQRQLAKFQRRLASVQWPG